MRLRAAVAAFILICVGQKTLADNEAPPAGCANKSDNSAAATPATAAASTPAATGTSANSGPAFKGVELQPTLAPVPPPPLYHGKPVQLSGGVVDKELEIEWDDWRNQFGNAIERRTFRSAVDAMIVPLGITAYFHCTVTADRHVKDIRITKSSGTLWYDRAVKDAVTSMDGESILAFPAGSQRLEVSFNIGLTHVDKKTNRYIYFGDVEHQTIDESH